MKVTPRQYAYVAVAILVGEIAIEGAHVAMREPWLGFSNAGSLTLSAMWSALWLVGALGLAFHRKWGVGFGLAGALGSLLHGLVVVTAGSPFGMVYFVIGVALIFLLKRAGPWFGWSLFADADPKPRKPIGPTLTHRS